MDFLAELAKEASKAPITGKGDQPLPNQQSSSDDMLKQFALEAEQKIKPTGKEPEAAVTPRLGKGFVRGAMDVIDTGATAIGYLDQKIDEFLGGGGSKRNKEFKERIGKEQKEYEDVYGSDIPSNIGRVGGQIAATAPFMPVRAIQGVNVAFKATPTILAGGEKVAAPLINRLGASVATGALGGAVYGAATSGSNEKSLERNIGENVLTGAIGGPVVTAAGAAGSKLGSKLIGNVSDTVADLAKRAETLGIDLKPSQVSNSQFFKKLDQVTGWLPFSGQQKLDDKQLSQFARAISRTFNKNTDELSPQLLRTSKADLGKDYETVAAATSMNKSPQLKQDIYDFWQKAKELLENPDQQKLIAKRITSILDKFDPVTGQMSGEAWQAMRRTKEPLSLLAKRNDNVGYFAKELRNIMDAEFNRSAPQDMQALLKATNARYKAIKTIEKLVEGSPDGNISPLRLMAAVQKAPGGKSGAGELGELADIGRQFFPTPADSGTPLGTGILNTIVSGVQNPMTAAAAAGGAALKGATYIDLGLGAAGLAANRLAREALTSKKLKDSIVRRSKGETYTSLNKLADVIAPHSAVLAKPANPLRITVSGREPTEQ